MVWIEELYPELKVGGLRTEYLDEVSQIPTKEVTEEEVDQEDTLEEETSTRDVVEAPSTQALET